MSFQFDSQAIDVLSKIYLRHEGIEKEEDSSHNPNVTGSSGDQNRLPYAEMYHEMITHAHLLKLLMNEIHANPLPETESMHLKILLYGVLLKFDEICFKNYVTNLDKIVGEHVSGLFKDFLKRTDALQIIRKNAIDIYDFSVLSQNILCPFIDNQSKILNIIVQTEKPQTPVKVVCKEIIKKPRRLGVLKRSSKTNIGEILGREIKTAVEFYGYDSESKSEFETKSISISEPKESQSLMSMFKIGIDKKESKSTNLSKKKSNTEIKPTASYLLRLKSNITKMHDSETNWIKTLCKGGYDSAVIASYANEKKAEIENEEMIKIEKKHLDGLLTFEEMLIARENLVKKNKEKYEHFLEEKKTWEQQIELWKAKENQRILNTVEQVQSIKENVFKAKKVAEESKRNVSADLKQIKETNKCRIIEGKQKELEKKCSLIKQIKALHVVVKTLNKDKVFDFTETSNIGLFCEMSLSELKERLSQVKVEMQKEMANRRTHVLEMKKQSQVKKENAKEIIEEFQRDRRNTKLLMSQFCRDDKTQLRAVQSDERITALRNKLAEKRAIRRAIVESR